MMQLDNVGFSGFNGFKWFIATVVDRDDPLQIGRVRVRIVGIHSENIADNELPWATPLQPIFSAANQGVGDSPVGLLLGSAVVGFFLDGDFAQQPVIIGSFAGAPGGISELPLSAIGDSSELDQKRPIESIEPASEFAAQYPHNRVYRSESGHIIEIDDTPEAERLNILHRTGTYTEIGPTGTKVDKVVDDAYKVVKGKNWLYVEGDCAVYVRGTIDVYAYSDINLNVAGDANIVTAGATRIKAKSVAIESEENIDMIAGGDVNIDGSKVYIASGTAVPTGLPDADFAEFKVVSPTIIEQPQMELDGGDDDIARQAAAAKLGDIVGNDQLDAEEEKTFNVEEKEVNVSICSITEEDANNVSYKLSKYYTIADLTIKAKYQHTLKAQRGLSKSQIACNMQALAINCLDPLRDYSRAIGGGNLFFTSGFRPEGSENLSRHELGQCADVRFTNYMGTPNQETFDFYFNMAEWCIKNLPYDQLILEVLTTGSRLPWIHIGFDRNGNRGDYYTYVNHKNVIGSKVKKLVKLTAPVK